MENRKNEHGETHTSSSTSAVAGPVATTTTITPPVNNNNNTCVALVAVTTTTTAATPTAATVTGTSTAATTGATSSPSTHTPPVQQHHHHHHHHSHSHHGSISGQGSGTSSTGASSSTSSSSSSTRTRPAVFDKLEQLVRDMQDEERGVPVRSQKMFLTSIPAAFMGYDLIEWLMDRLSIEDSLEAVHLANLLCQFGYYFPINELKNLLVKDDSSLYRFQTPYYWPSQHHTPDNIEYAIYLDKRSQRNRQKHGLEDYELDAYNNLRKILANRWDFVQMQADEQLKIAKDRKKGEKIITDSQEKAYWRVYRPPPGYTTVVESSPVPTREQRSKARSRTKEHLAEEFEFLKSYLATSRSKLSQVSESLIDYTDTFFDYDPFLIPVIPSNPWVADEPTYWMLNQPIVEAPTEKRVRKWAISLEDLIIDPLGLQELLSYMKKEYSHENLRFWLAVQELRRGPGSEAIIKKHVKEIWDEFLSPGAKAEINIDAQTMELTKQNMKIPTRFTFDEAANHIYMLLLKKDCYPRFIRSDHYKTLLANALKPRNMKKTFFNFPARKKPTTNTTSQSGTQGPGNPANAKERLWEDFNIYGAQGGDNGESPETNTFDRNLCRDINESVCPWDNFGGETKKSPRGSVGSAGSHKRRGSDPTISTSRCTAAAAGVQGGHGGDRGTSPHRGKHRAHHQSTEGKAVGATAKSCSATRTSSLENSLERTGSCRRRQADGRGSLQEEGSAGSHHHHHHHHHHVHGSGASRRSKQRSKRKKTSIRSSTLTSAGELAAAIAAAATASTTTSSTTTTTSTQFNAPAQEQQRIHAPPHHQHSASSLVTSVVAPASLLMVTQSTEKSSSLLVTASGSTESSDNVVPTTATTSSKCTQTKLDDEDDLFNIPTSPTLARQSPVRGVHMMSTLRDHQLNTRRDLPSDDSTEAVESGIPVTRTSSVGDREVSPKAKPLNTKTREKTPELIEPGSAEQMRQPEAAISIGTSQSGRSNSVGALSSGAVTAGVGEQENVAAAASESGGPECKGDIGTWASSTEVCPWEDEENRRDSHPPFVKTYATLGFL